MKKLLILTIFLGKLAIFSQSEKSELRVFTFEEVEKLQQQKAKPIVVFMHTDWCKICFGMKQNTLKDQEVIRILNEQFYFVKLNGEEKKDIFFLGKKFVYKPSGAKTGTHELAKELASINNKIQYPTTTILNTNLEIAFQINTYINSKNMYFILEKTLLNKN
jgi:thioredoxin-related protein